MKMKSISAKALLLLLLFPAIVISAEPDREAIEKEVFAVLDKFMSSFNAMDPVAHVTTYHFPHFRLARGSMSSWVLSAFKNDEIPTLERMMQGSCEALDELFAKDFKSIQNKYNKKNFA